MSTGEQDYESPVTALEENEPGTTETPKRKLDLDVQITDVGPCQKHLKVAIARSEIDRQFDESIGTMRREASVPGFRPGRAPRQLFVKRFRKQVADQVKSTLLMSCLEQLDEDYKLNPISQPNLDLAAIELPEEGPMLLELDLEVRPDFPLPDYKSLAVERPVKTLTDADVEAQLKSFLERYAQMVPKLEGGAEIGDFITADISFQRDGQTLNASTETQFRLLPELRFQDGNVPDVGTALAGVTAGETRETDAKIGSGCADPSLRGQTIRVSFKVHDLKQLRLPEVNASFLHGIGFDSVDELKDALKGILERRLKTQQHQAMRRQIIDQLMAQSPFDLPVGLVKRQEKATLRRLILNMQQEGLGEADIRAREADIRANARESALRGLKEFFLLAKIAEAEKIEVEPADMEAEIDQISQRTDESPRRIRARIEKEGMAEAIVSEILERRTIERILELVTFTEVPLVEQHEIETLDHTATTAEAEDESEELEGEAPVAAAEPEASAEPGASATESGE